MQTSKRVLALLLCAVMLFTTVPVEAFATGEVPSDETVVTEPVVEETESTGIPSETEAEAETSAPEEVTEEPAVSPEEEVTEEVTEPEEEAAIQAISDDDVVRVTDGEGNVTGYASLQAAFDGFAPSNNTYGGTYTVTLLADNAGNLYKNLQYPTSTLDITLDLNGHTITGDGTTYTVVINFGSSASKGSSFTIMDSVGGGTITGGKGGVKLDGTDCTLYFRSGNITGNHGGSKGGGIFMGARAKLVMTGGAIYGNSVTGTSSANTGYGGGICANYADILGGAIYGNTAYKGSHLQTGRGGGVCTEITRTTGYSTLNIADGVVFGNTAENAGDDIMAQGNGNVKFTLVIGTENWYIDGWNGTKAGSGGGQTDRYNAENPVAYTAGGFANYAKTTVGLKYVAPSTEPEVPAAPYDNGGSDTNVADFIQFVDANGHGALLMNITGGFTAGEVVWNEELGTWTCDLTFDAAALLAVYNESYAGHRYADEIGETITVTHKWFCGEGAELSTTEGKWVPNVDGNIYKVNVTCKAIYTVTYTDGVEDEEIFADQTHTVEEGEATPAFNGEPTREGYTFAGWTPEVAGTVTGNVTYSAQWEKIPVYVARLESTGEQFETLQAALDAAKAALAGDLDADKITMIGDTTECVKLAWSRNNGSMTLTIDLNGHTVTGNGTGSVMTFSGLTSYNGRFAIVIEDSSESKTGTITGGVATSGGAIKLDGAKGGDSLTINGGNFTGNTATSSGGALYCAVVGATITVNGGTFSGNTAKTGGAISAYSVVINGGSFTKNSATGDAKFTGRGGAIQVWGTGAVKLEINGGTFSGNTAARYGDDVVFCSTNNTSASMKLVEMTGMKWYVDGYYGAQSSEANLSERFSEDNAVEFTDYDFSGKETKGIAVALKLAERVLPPMPEAPDKYGKNVTEELIRVICDSDTDHAPLTIKWQHQSTKVRDWVSGVVWSEEQNTWIVPIRIDSVSVYYVWAHFEDTYNDILHDMVDEDQQCIDTYLKWDADKQLWVTLDEQPIDVHVTCKTIPDVPSAANLGRRSFQIQVKGDLDGDGIYGENGLTNDSGIYELYTTTIPAQFYENLVVYGSREEGFFIDVTVNLEDGDLFITNWIEKRAPGEEYFYNWDMTQKTITFTLKYNGDLEGTLYGDDAKYWVLSTTGEIFGKVGEAYVGKYVDVVYTDGVEGAEVFADQTFSVMTGKATPAFEGTPEREGYTFAGWTPEVAETVTGPATYTATWTPNAPTQKNVVEDLVTIICDSDPDRHAPVTGKWYPQHCKTTSDIVWNEELGTWTVDIRIGSLYIMYVDQLEDANNGTIHELVEDITTVYSTLKWDAEQALWVPTQPIELHTTCRTAPIAPNYNQIDGYQVKVWGDANGDGVLEAYTTSIPEDGYVLSEVYGSREEGFFVDVTITIKNGDAYITNWIAKRDPGAEYLYDFEKTPETITFTLRYNGSLTGTLYGDRHASNTNYDWVLDTTGKTYGVVGEGYVVEKTYAVQMVIYRNGNTNAPYDVISLGRLAKGEVIDLTALDIADYYSSYLGYEFEGWFNDGAWNQYKAGKEVAGLEEITVNGWTNIICMVTDYQRVQIQIYRNGNTTDVYKTIVLDNMLKGDTLDLTTLDINDYYSSTYGFEFNGWYNDGKWNQYKAGKEVTGLEEITINGWTNIICMVNDNQKIVVKAVTNGDKDNAEVIFTGVAPYGTDLTAWLNENVEVEREGYTADKWYNWDWYGHKYPEGKKVTGWTNAYVTYTANEYIVSFNTNGGPEVDPVTVTFGEKYGRLPSAVSVTGLSSRKNDWYLVDENGNVTDINIRNTSVVSVARDHELFLMRDVLAPTLKITLEVPGGISNDYKYYIPGNSTRVLTVTVNNMNEEVLDYTYQWYKDGVAIEGATEAVLTLEGNVSDSGTYKVVVTATLKDGSEIVVKVDTASGEKSLKVQIMRAANTLRLNHNYGETPETHDSYFGGAVANIRGTATREGYTFAGWNTAADGSGETYQVGDEVAFPGDNGNGGVVLELFAVWTPNTYVLNLDANGGVVDPTSVEVTYTAPIGELPVPTRDMWVFAGWFDADGNEVTAETIYNVIGDSTVTAKWEPAVARVESTGVYYTTLQGAVDDAAELMETGAQTVTLVADTTENVDARFDNYGTTYTFDLTIDLAGHTVTGTGNGSVFTVGRLNSRGGTGMHITFTDSVGNGTVTGGNTAKGGAIYVHSGKTGDTVTLKGGIFTGNTATTGGVVYNGKKEVEVIVDGATLTGNTATSSGGAIWSWNLTVKSGVITGNTAKTGGGIFAQAAYAVLNVQGGQIYGNTATEMGNDIFFKNPGAQNKAVLTLTAPQAPGMTGWYVDGYLGNAETERYSADYNVEYTDYSVSGNDVKRYGVALTAGVAASTVTYTDGVEDAELFADQAYKALAGEATPAFEGETPTRKGYTFEGWNPEVTETVTGDVTYEAVWKAVELKVYYYIDGELVNEFVLSGEAVTAVNVYDYMPEKAGYTLTCWYEKAADIGNTVKAEPNAEQDLTNKKVIRLYGSYEPITYRIKYAGGEGAEYVGDLPNSKNDWAIIAGYPYGEEITLHDGTGFQRTGYTLTGWTIKGKTYALGGTAEGSFTTVQSGLIIANAIWEGNSYTLILDANGGEFVMPLAEDSDAVTTVEIPVTYGDVIGELPTPVREGYTFAGWFDAEGNEITAETVYNVDGDLTVTAKWTPNTYEVKLDANGGKVDDDTIEVTYGEPIGELPTPTRDGYTFAGWVDADGNKVDADTIYDVADDITLIATWTVNKPADPSSPATGDGMTMFFMVSMLVSAGALLFLADRKRRMAA